jgi:hypothetical protein
MKVAYFTHSLQSCWNHGNAHFLRGVLRELMALGHEVTAYEPQDAWSLVNLLGDHGQVGLECFSDAYPELRSEIVTDQGGVERACAGADAVIVHEWNEPALVAQVGRLRAQGGRFTLLFHDTHHRAVSEPEAMRAYDLSGYDGVLAFGETLSEVYRAGAGATASGPGTKPPTPACSSRRPRRPSGMARSGSATGATASGRKSWSASSSTPRRRPASRSTSMACATQRRRWRLWPATACAITAGWPTRRRPASSPGTR